MYTASQFDHVSMIIRNLFPDEPDKVHIFESVGGAGVRITDWDSTKK